MKNKRKALIDALCGSESTLCSGELSKDAARFGCAGGLEPVFVCCGVSAAMSNSSSETLCTESDPVCARQTLPLRAVFTSLCQLLINIGLNLFFNPTRRDVCISCPKSKCKDCM